MINLLLKIYIPKCLKLKLSVLIILFIFIIYILFNIFQLRLFNLEYCKSDSIHSVCFLGKRFCHPGFEGVQCDRKKILSNPWYTNDCPNLEEEVTYDVNMPLEIVSSGYNCKNDKKIKGLSVCAYLCFSNPVVGVAQIPKSLWKIYQGNQLENWKKSNADLDQGYEHIEGFNRYNDLTNNLGDFIEIGSSPFRQTQFLINKTFSSITLLDSGALNYMQLTPGCKFERECFYGKKVRMFSYDAEKMNKYDSLFGNYDTLLAVNGVEHVWDAYLFLKNVYEALKPGGLLIYHDRFYPNPIYGDRILGAGNLYSPIRLKKLVFDVLLEKFQTIFMFEGQTSDQINRKNGEVGFYFIGRKKL